MASIPENAEPYTKYSKFYDFLLKDQLDYDGDCDFVVLTLAKLGYPKPLRILDIGCGTGEHAMRLVRRGYQVTGIDSSAQMIGQAIKKARAEDIEAKFFIQDMRKIKLNQVFHCAISLRGSFPRLIDEDDFKPFFEGLGGHLIGRGLFIFDFINADGVVPGHRDWKFKEKGNLAVIRLDRSDFRQELNLLEEYHEFFIMEGDNLTDRWRETHRLRTHGIGEIEGTLQKYGFDLLKPRVSVAEKVDSDKLQKPPFDIRAIARKSD